MLMESGAQGNEPNSPGRENTLGPGFGTSKGGIIDFSREQTDMRSLDDDED